MGGDTARGKARTCTHLQEEDLKPNQEEATDQLEGGDAHHPDLDRSFLVPV